MAAVLGPQIVTNFHKLICGDMCRFVDKVFFNKINRIGIGVVYIL